MNLLFGKVGSWELGVGSWESRGRVSAMVALLMPLSTSYSFLDLRVAEIAAVLGIMLNYRLPILFLSQR
ncbi:hypothetical protein [Chamaesiphon polymorphus]|uniref:hypothetical protein n=1 Tax=Chamaesiphon polymorphus TaxID=2107691 RepID=UPI0011B241DD|nr:hypothetical protein [Chamaesiphon polymorphus]